MRWLVPAAVIVMALVTTSSRADSPSETANQDEQILREAHQPTDDIGLLDMFRKRLLSAADKRKVETLITQLNDDSYKVREAASEQLIDFGPAAAPLIRQALKSPVLEVSRRAKKCLTQIAPPSVDVLSAAARLLAVRRPDGAVETLLNYLPVADDEELAGEIRSSLAALAFQHGRPAAALIRALHAHQAVLRSAAVDALFQSGGRRGLPLLRPLLRDPHADVRLHTAEHLAELRLSEAIPVLIELTAHKATTAGLADAYLRDLADTQAPAATPGQTDASCKASHDAWQHWWQVVDAGAILEHIRRGTPDENARLKVTELIRELGDDDFVTRERATEAVVRMGAVAVPLLQKAMADDDAEVAHRATTSLSRIEKGPQGAISATELRLIAFRKPAGVARVLLAYLPFANGEEAQEEVSKALTAVAYPNGRPSATVLAALDDPLAVRRSAAATALINGAVEPPTAVRRLLRDSDKQVRLRVALALVRHKDRSAVPGLIDLLGDLNADQLWQTEEVLRQLAGADAPRATLGTDPSTRARCRQAWLGWWQKYGDRVDMALLDSAPRMLGYTLIVQFTNWGNNTGRVYEIGPDKKVRWHIEGLNLPVDAQMVGRNHVLIAEFYGGEVTERDLKGKVLWRQGIGNPVSVQRLANGHTFMAGQNQIMEVDRAGKTIYSFNPPNGACMGARKLRNGQIVAVSNGGMLARTDTKGKVFKTFNVGNVNWGGLDVTHNGHILVPQQNMSKVVEYDQDGKQVWQVSSQWPSSAVRLPNGNTLICSQNMQQIHEVNRAGKSVWEYRPDGRPWHVRRR